MRRLYSLLVLITILGLYGCRTETAPKITPAPVTASASTTIPTPTTTSTPTSAPETAESKVRARCREILAQYGATIEGIYAYINNTDPLQRLYYNSADMPRGEIPETAELALHILNTGKGVCYHYSALTYYLLQEAGYEAILITGLRKMDDAPHRWTMVKTEKGWYHFDPQHYQKLLTDEQKNSSSYLGGNAMYWDTSLYPATPESL